MRYDAGKCLLRIVRKKNRLTQKELGHRLEVSQTHISDYENNRNKIPIDLAFSIIKELDCELDDLYEWVPRRRRKG